MVLPRVGRLLSTAKLKHKHMQYNHESIRYFALQVKTVIRGRLARPVRCVIGQTGRSACGVIVGKNVRRDERFTTTILRLAGHFARCSMTIRTAFASDTKWRRRSTDVKLIRQGNRIPKLAIRRFWQLVTRRILSTMSVHIDRRIGSHSTLHIHAFNGKGIPRVVGLWRKRGSPHHCFHLPSQRGAADIERRDAPLRTFGGNIGRVGLSSDAQDIRRCRGAWMDLSVKADRAHPSRLLCTCWRWVDMCLG